MYYSPCLYLHAAIRKDSNESNDQEHSMPHHGGHQPLKIIVPRTVVQLSTLFIITLKIKYHDIDINFWH